MYKYSILFLFGVLFFNSCKKTSHPYKASGVIEAKEIIVSAESSGTLILLDIEEGMRLKARQTIGKIGCSQQVLMANQAETVLHALKSKKQDAGPTVRVLEQQAILQGNQIAVWDEQLITLKKEEIRIQKLVSAEAVPSKQLDDIQAAARVMDRQIITAKAQINVINEQIKAALENVGIQNRAILSEQSPLQARVEQLKELENRCLVINPIEGTVLSQYAFLGESVNIGKAIYKIANLDTVYLKAYITGVQLNEIKLGQNTTVSIPKNATEFQNFSGTIIWISDKAEFTPKSIMTIDERANLVYAIKIKIANDGHLKLGMFADLNW